MSPNDRLERLAEERFRDLPQSCGNGVNPGVVAASDWRDWTRHETTVDQQRIEDYLDRFRLSGKRILHVGVGNSSLARKFGHRAREVVGISIDPPELALARSLGVATYCVFERNKYAALGPELDGPFDFIVDNNIASACCCLSHLLNLLEAYRDRLAPAGQILTDREGLGWIPNAPGLNPRWRFTLDDLAIVAGLAALTTEPIGDQLAALSRGDRAQPTAAAEAARLLRRAPRALASRVKRFSTR